MFSGEFKNIRHKIHCFMEIGMIALSKSLAFIYSSFAMNNSMTFRLFFPLACYLRNTLQ